MYWDRELQQARAQARARGFRVRQRVRLAHLNNPGQYGTIVRYNNNVPCRDRIDNSVNYPLVVRFPWATFPCSVNELVIVD